MKRFSQHDLLVVPVETIRTGRKADFSPVSPLVHRFEEHVPGVPDVQHKRIGDERRYDVSDMLTGQHGIVRLYCWRQMTWRGTGVNANGPLLPLPRRSRVM